MVLVNKKSNKKENNGVNNKGGITMRNVWTKGLNYSMDLKEKVQKETVDVFEKVKELELKDKAEKGRDSMIEKVKEMELQNKAQKETVNMFGKVKGLFNKKTIVEVKDVYAKQTDRKELTKEEATYLDVTLGEQRVMDWSSIDKAGFGGVNSITKTLLTHFMALTAVYQKEVGELSFDMKEFMWTRYVEEFQTSEEGALEFLLGSLKFLATLADNQDWVENYDESINELHEQGGVYSAYTEEFAVSPLNEQLGGWSFMAQVVAEMQDVFGK